MPGTKKNIYLIGPMGSGKTTIGTRLAEKMGLTFFDSDHEIEKDRLEHPTSARIILWSKASLISLSYCFEDSRTFRQVKNRRSKMLMPD